MKISSFSMHFLALAAAICMVSIKAQRPQQEEAAKFYVSRFDIENGFGETSPDELSSEVRSKLHFNSWLAGTAMNVLAFL